MMVVVVVVVGEVFLGRMLEGWIIENRQLSRSKPVIRRLELRHSRFQWRSMRFEAGREWLQR